MSEIRDSLAQVLELLGRATPGPYESHELPSEVSEIFSAGDFNIYPPLGESGPVAVASGHHNAAAIISAVNWLREHGPELMKMLEGKDG